MKSARQDGLAKPQHPLPKEIQDMKRDETVCQFCGVSYLIHNEIKKLEDEIIKLKAEIERYSGFDKREADMKKMLAEEKLRNKQINADLLMAKSRHESITDVLEKANNLLQAAESENELYKNRLQEKEREVTKFADKFQRNQHLLETMLRTLRCMKAEKESCQDQVESLKSKILQSMSQAVSYCHILGDKYSTERSSHLLENTKLQDELNKAKADATDMKTNMFELKEHLRVKNELEMTIKTLKGDLAGTKKEILQIGCEKDSVSDALCKMKSMLGERNRRVDNLESANAEKDKLLQEAKHKLEKLDSEHKREIEKLQRRVHEHEKELECLQTKKEEEREAATTSSIQLKVLKDSWDKAREEIAVLKQERQAMIDAHQNRIKQLIESFNEKLLEADAWPKKLEEKLTEQQLRFNEEKSELWQKLNESFKQEMEDLKKSFEKEKQEAGKKEAATTNKLKSQLETLQRRSREEIDNLKSNLSREQEMHLKISRSQEELITNLEMKIDDLEMRLKNLSQRTTTDDESYKNKYMNTKRALEHLKEDFLQLENEMMEKRQEVAVLQETVRRECEERFELTDALSEARLQLLAVQKGASLKRSSHTSIAPSPPSTRDLNRKDLHRRVKPTDTSEHSLNSSQCSASHEKGITVSNSTTFNDESRSRKRIADALAKQRASSRTSFDKFR